MIEAKAQPAARERDPDSFTSQIERLEVGQCVSRTELINCPSARLEDVQASLSAWKTDLRNRSAPSLKYAKQRTNNTYRMEVCDFMTGDYNWYITAVVTRLS